MRALRILGPAIDKPATFYGHLHLLWWWALDNVPADGDLGDTTDDEIEAAAEWDGPMGLFVQAITAAGFIEHAGNARALHDWWDYAGQIGERRDRVKEGNRKRQAEWRERNAKVTRDVTRDGLENNASTVPYQDTTKTQPEPEREDAGASPPPSADEIADAWNETCPPTLAEVRELTAERRQKIRTRCAKAGRDLAWWRAYFARIRASPFCCGNNDRGWRADFGWAIKSEENVAKVLEGKYDERGPTPQKQSNVVGIVHALQAAGRLPKPQVLEVVADESR